MKTATLSVLFASAFAIMAQSASAITVVSSNAYGVYSDVRVVNTVGVVVGPVAAVNGITPPGYDKSATVASLNAAIDLGLVSLIRAGLDINTGILTSTTNANGNLLGGTNSGFASALVNQAGVNLFTKAGILPAVTTLGLGADSIRSSSYAATDGSNGFVRGQSVLSNLDLTVLSLLDIHLAENAQVAANTVVLDTLGLKIVLNEQIITGNGTTDAAIQTNAFHLFFDDYVLGLRTITGGLVIGHSAVRIQVDPHAPSVPEPAAWLEMIAGFGIIGVIARRRQPLLG